MNVLMLGWELPPYNSGGLGEACMGLTKALTKKNNINITFVLPQKVNLKVDHMNLVFADLDDGNILYNAYTTEASFSSSVQDPLFPSGYVHGAFTLAKKISAIAKRYKADIIHSHDWMTFPAGIAVQQYMKKPLVTHVHSTEFDRTGGHFPNPIVYEIEKEGVRRSNRVISVSKLTKDTIISQYAVDPSKIDVVYNGLDVSSKKVLPTTLKEFKDNGYKIILFLGRITLQKGPEYFVRTAKKITEYEEKVVFVVAGSGDMESQMIEEAANLGILHHFFFTGFLRGVEKDRIYQSADVYVMPSVSEPFGITTLEAVANDICVLASKQSGVSEVLTHILKSDFWDIDDMANKIVALLRYPALKIDLRKESKKELKNIHWDKAADATLSIYNQLL